jgi:hypothetical protein
MRTYLMSTPKPVTASIWALLLSFIFMSPDATLAQQKTRQQLIGRHDELLKELELVLQQLKDAYSKCNPQEFCKKEAVCPISRRSLDIAREMRDVVHDLYYVHDRGYLSWVKRTESDADKTGEYHYKILGCSE